MNVYDWDNTIYRGDSTFHFVLYLWGHYPKTWLTLPRTLWCGLLYLLGLMKKQRFKQNLFRTFRYVKDMKRATAQFARTHLDGVQRWYVEQRAEDDIIISASPEFLVQEFVVFMRSLRMADESTTVIGSPVEMATGKYYGVNCYGEEKVRQFKALVRARAEQKGDLSFKWPMIEEFYSDSLSDAPLARLARNAYLVKKGKLQPWPKDSTKKGA